MVELGTFPRIDSLPPYVLAEVTREKQKYRHDQLDIIDFGMGIPDGPTPQIVVDKLKTAVDDKRNHRYSQSIGIPMLRVEIAKRYQARYGVRLDPDSEAIVSIGAKDALAHLLIAVLNAGDGVATHCPSYPIHMQGVVFAGGVPFLLEMPSPDEFLNRLHDLYRMLACKPRMILISFPHNPTTQCVELDFFKEIVRLAHQHGTMVVHDFAYADLGFDGYQPPSMLQVPGAKEVGVEIFSLSKSFNMSGWRVGFCIGNLRMVEALRKIKSYLDYGVFQPIQIASIIAMRHCEEDTRRICATYQRRRDVLVEGLNSIGWPVDKPRGTMFVWAPIPESFQNMGSLQFSKLLLEKALVAVSPGVGFGPFGEGYVRFALIENFHRTRQALHNLKTTFRGWESPHPRRRRKQAAIAVST